MLGFKKPEKDLQMSSSYIAISATNLSKRYDIYDRPSDRLRQFLLPKILNFFRLPIGQYSKDFWAINEISFEINKGETVGIIGKNGSGKSTLLQIICGTVNPTIGAVKITGRVAALLELGSGFNTDFTGRENIYMSASVLGLTPEEISDRFESIVAFADIGIFIDQPIKTYSSGMTLRLAFSVIAHVDADILVIDEALAVGDVFFTQKCMRFLRKFMETGTILFVSHDIASLVSLCSRVIWLDNGKLIKDGSPKEVSQSYLASYYKSSHSEKINDELFEIQLDKKDSLTNKNIEYKDIRQDVINSSKYRNDLEVSNFNFQSEGFGEGGGKIISVTLNDTSGAPLSWTIGGEFVQLKILCIAKKHISSPIIGFYLNDKLGQKLFGDNTYRFSLIKPLFIERNEKFEAIFEFKIPILPIGDYSITVALAEGTQQEHIQHDWLHDALILKSHSSSISTGLLGVPMSKVGLQKYD